MGTRTVLYKSFNDWLDKIGVEEVARRLDVRPLTIWTWRNNRANPKVSQMKKIRRLSKGGVTYEMIIDRKLIVRS